MPKRAVSVTLDEDNLQWLRGRMARRKRRSLSDAIDEVLTNARTSGVLEPIRSVVGTIAIDPDDSDLERAGAYVRSLFEESLGRPLVAHEDVARYDARPKQARKPRTQKSSTGG